VSKVTIQLHTQDPSAARWRATANIERPGAEKDDEYGGYGATPLEAVTDLAKDLANVIGYERAHGFADQATVS
jgi:hypothetical protein